MPFQTSKTFVHLWNTKYDILMKSESFLSCIDSNATTTFKGQKGSKDIIKIFHVTSVVQPYIFEATRILFVRNENKNNDLFNSLWRAFTRVPRHMHVVLLTQEPAFWHRTQIHCALFTSRGMHTHTSWYCCEWWRRLTQKRRNCWIKSLFLFSLHIKSILVAS